MADKTGDEIVQEVPDVTFEDMMQVYGPRSGSEDQLCTHGINYCDCPYCGGTTRL